MSGAAEARDRLIVALDLPSVDEAGAMVSALGDTVSFYKVGYQLCYAPGGLDFAADLVRAGKRVFVDLKLHDIGNTVGKGIEALARMGAAMTTVHAYPQTMRAAAQAADGTGLLVLGVTVLTSWDENDLSAAGLAGGVEDTVLARARQAVECGVGGLVASAAEARRLRSEIGSDMAIVTPGIRPTGSARDDQKRAVSPSDAIAAGASHLVVGRPIVGAADPLGAARAILIEIDAGVAALRFREN